MTDPTPSPAPAAKPEKKPLPMGRIALIAAGLMAVTAVGVAISRSGETPSAPGTNITDAGETPPSVDEVIASLEKKLQEKPDDAEGWRMLGWSYFETERFAEAATAMRRAISLNPKNAEYHSMLGEALVMASKTADVPKDARAAFATAVQLDPKDARARYFIAVAKDLDGQHAAAIEDWFALLKDTPADAPYAQDIREVIANVGKERGIDVEKRLAATSFAPAAQRFRTYGPDVAGQGIPGPTREQMQAATKLPSGQQDAMVQGMVDGLADKLAKNPRNPEGWIMLMRSRMQLGETAKAAEALKTASATFRNDAAELRRIKEAAASLGVPGA